MSDDFLTQRQMNPGSIPGFSSIERIFWDCLAKAENIFGPRAVGYEYTVKLRQSEGPPETINHGQGQVSVWLNPERSWVGYYYEAAHEAVHCLNPSVPRASAMYIEEAIACGFSLNIVLSIFGQSGVDKCAESQDYLRARALASEIDEDMLRLGRRLRESAGALRSVTVEVVEKLYPDAPHRAVVCSLAKFPRQ